MSDVLSKLRGMNDRMKAVEVQEGSSSDNFPDGSYTGKVEKCFLTAVKNGENKGELQVAWWIRIKSGPTPANRVYFLYHPIYGKDDEQLDIRLGRLKTDFHRLELDITDMEQLPAYCTAVETAQLELKFSLKTNRREGAEGIQNCYINGLVKQQEG